MRFEYKYIVPVERLDSLRESIRTLATPDEFTSRGFLPQYTVRSIYFDTPRFNAYHEKLDGIRARKKLRIRAYNEMNGASNAFLEIKMKVDQRGSKHRAAVPLHSLPRLLQTKDIDECLIPGANAEAAQACANRFLYHVVRSSMSPTVLVTYEREAYYGRFDGTLRVTFDKRLRYLPFPAISDLFEEHRLRFVAPRLFIMEVKFGSGFAPWLQSIVKKHNLSRTSVSKYASCVSACDEFKPMLKYHAVHLPKAEPEASEVVVC